MHCPLCGGPVSKTEDGYECEIGHRVDGDHILEFTELQLAEALWMAIQALDNEADVLRAIGGADGASFAEAADQQSRMLREFARRHAPRVDDSAAT